MLLALILFINKMLPDFPCYLIYMSLAVGRMSAGQLIEVSGEMARHYDHYQVTGVSLYAESRFITKLEGRFLHMLESSEENLPAVYAMCLKNTWEHSLIKVSCGSCTDRLYSNWTLTSLCTPALDRHVSDMTSGLNGKPVISWREAPVDRRLMILNQFCQLNGWAGEAHPQMRTYDSCQELIEPLFWP